MNPQAKLIPAGKEEHWSDTGMDLRAVSPRISGAPTLWFARFTAEGGVSIPRHTHTADTVAYLVSGRASFTVGMDGEERIDMGPGDFLYMPADIVHTEETLGDEQAVFLLARDGGGGDTIFVDE